MDRLTHLLGMLEGDGTDFKIARLTIFSNDKD